MCQSMVDIQPAAAEIRRGKKIEDRKKLQGKNIMAPLLYRAAIISRRYLFIHSTVSVNRNVVKYNFPNYYCSCGFCQLLLQLL